MVKKPATRTGSHRVLAFAGLSIAVLVLAIFIGLQAERHTAQLSTGGALENTSTTLAACSGSTLLFPRNRVNVLETWRTAYHQNVSAVVSSVLAQSQQNQCTVSQSQNVPTVMLALASQLPPWRDTERLKTVRTEDVGSVLLEYLRLYECSLQEQASVIPVRSGLEILQKALNENKPLVGIPVTEATNEAMRQLRLVAQEMTVSRPAMHRSLLYLASTMRLGSLGQEIDCLLRTSADLRNTLGLAAETSACLPRIWDARGALRNSGTQP